MTRRERVESWACQVMSGDHRHYRVARTGMTLGRVVAEEVDGFRDARLESERRGMSPAEYMAREPEGRSVWSEEGRLLAAFRARSGADPEVIWFEPVVPDDPAEGLARDEVAGLGADALAAAGRVVRDDGSGDADPVALIREARGDRGRRRRRDSTGQSPQWVMARCPGGPGTVLRTPANQSWPGRAGPCD